MNEQVRSYMKEIGSKGGSAGKGTSKARTELQRVKAAFEKYKKQISHWAPRRHNSMNCILSKTAKCGSEKIYGLTLFGCRQKALRWHIERQFYKGRYLDMAWDNKDRWHIDHIMPRHVYDESKPLEVLECWHWTNLRPLWEEDNFSKGGKITHHFKYSFDERRLWIPSETVIDSEGMVAPK